MIKVESVSFSYGTGPPAVNGLSFQIERGEIFGFLGPSGSGKSTTQKILIRLLKGNTGKITVLDRPLETWNHEYFEHVGVCFESPSHYRKLTALENLLFFARFFKRKTRTPEELLDLVGLGSDGNRRVEKFSKGMMIRLNFARALLQEPELLFLDEPTAGLDPAYGRQIRDIIVDQQKRGATVFLTTHDMKIANELCDRVGFLVDGQLKSVDSPEALRLKYGRRAVAIQLKDGDGMRTKEFPLDGLGENEEYLRFIRMHRIETIHSMEPSLEDVFITVTGKQLA